MIAQKVKRHSAEPDRKMIPVTPETHARVMSYAGRIAAQTGQRAAMESAIIAALDALDGCSLQRGRVVPRNGEAKQP